MGTTRKRRTTRARAKAGRVGKTQEWAPVYAKTGRRIRKGTVYGLGSRARAKARRAAATHNRGR